MRKLFLLCCFLLLLSGTSKLLAIIRLPPIMSSNMVLQQNTLATFGDGQTRRNVLSLFLPGKPPLIPSLHSTPANGKQRSVRLPQVGPILLLLKAE